MSEPLPKPLEDEEALESLVAEVTDEFLQRLERGEHPTPDEYRQRYPQIADLLRQVLPALEAMRVSGPSAPLPRSPAEPAAALGCLGDFRLLHEIGRGGMGIVYEAEQISLRRRVALKVLPFAAALDPKRLERFRHEAQAAAHLHHSHIVPVFAVGCERGVYYYAMQYIEGQSLAEVLAQLRRRKATGDDVDVPLSVPFSQDVSAVLSGAESSEHTGPWSHGKLPSASAPSTPRSAAAVETNPVLSGTTIYAADGRAFVNLVVHWGIQAAEALEHAHSMGIVHRDIKPANLLIDVREHLWVTDFGLAQHCNDAGLTATGDLVGTLRYMSPEQALGERGRIDHRTDIYALAATLYELLTLQPLLQGHNREELLRQVIADAPVPPRWLNKLVPTDLETILLKALAKEPAERYASAGELAADLQRFLDHEPIRAKRPSPLERASKWVKRHRAVALAAVAMLLVTVVALAVSTALVVREQARTKAAYAQVVTAQTKTEEVLAARERELKQARQMLDFFTRVGEEELSEDSPARRKLLGAALNYYEQFIEQSADDPATKSELTNIQGRVSQLLRDSGVTPTPADSLEQLCLLQEDLVRKYPEVPELRFRLIVLYRWLGVLHGERLLDLAEEEPVREHLNLTPEQEAALRELEKTQRWPAAMSNRSDPTEVRHELQKWSAQIETELTGILTPAQKTRLEQILLQSHGWGALTEPRVATALKLTSDQIAAIRQKLSEGGPQFRPGHRGNPGEGEALARQLLQTLTPEQLTQWQSMTGERFPGAERLGRGEALRKGPPERRPERPERRERRDGPDRPDHPPGDGPPPPPPEHDGF